jgi:hypothetical protein
MTLTRKLQHNLVKDDALAAGTAEPVGRNGHVGSVGNGGPATLPLPSRALAGSANLGALLADSDKRTLAILELRRRTAAAKRRGFLVARNGLYDNDDERTDHSTADDLLGVFHLVTVGTWLLFVGSRVAGFAQPHLWRLVAFWALAIAMIALARGLARAFCRRRITYLQNVVIVGAGEVGQFVARKLLQHTEYGVNLLGFVDGEPRSLHPELATLRVLGRPDDLPAIVRLFDVDRVIFAFSSAPETSTRDLAQAMKELDASPAAERAARPHEPGRAAACDAERDRPERTVLHHDRPRRPAWRRQWTVQRSDERRAPCATEPNPGDGWRAQPVLAAGLVTAGLGTDGDRSSPNASDAAGPPPGPAAGAVRFVKHTVPAFDRFNSRRPPRALDYHIERVTLHAPRAADPAHREARDPRARQIAPARTCPRFGSFPRKRPARPITVAVNTRRTPSP